jgi:nitrite reductase (NO-forming)
MVAPEPTPTPTPASDDRSVSMSAAVLSLAAIVTVLAVTIAIVAVATRSSDDGPGAQATVAATGEVVTVDVELGEMYVEPSSIEVDAGAELVVNVTNAGDMPHDLVLGDGVGTRMLDPGESEEVSLGIISSDTQAWCTVPGHREAGMEMDIIAIGGVETADAAGHGVGPAPTDHALIDFNADPDDGWVPFDPELAPAPGGTEHEITLRATETVIEIAPGVTQELWTFEDQVPGPTLRGKVGDLFTVTLVNEGEIGHSIDFHASKVAWNDEMRTIAPGEELVYQFEAKHAGAFMYHCGTPPTLHHIGNGMHGAIIIDPPDLAEVDHEYVFVQSEYYTGPEGEPGDLAKMAADEWDAVTFNGYVNQYLHAPIRVEPGERVRTWVVNNGPSENSSFHIVGTVFDTVFKEGTRLLEPDGREGGAQALDLQPAQGGYVEFTFDVEGLYPIVTHKFSNVGKGALGLFQAGEVGVGEDAGH